jgi:hypothetical protein
MYYLQVKFNIFLRLVEEAVEEDGTVVRELRLYYTLDNSCEYHGEEPQFIVLPSDMISSVQFLISSYPDFVKVKDIPCPTDEEKVNIINYNFGYKILYYVSH